VSCQSKIIKVKFISQLWIFFYHIYIRIHSCYYAQYILYSAIFLNNLKIYFICICRYISMIFFVFVELINLGQQYLLRYIAVSYAFEDLALTVKRSIPSLCTLTWGGYLCSCKGRVETEFGVHNKRTQNGQFKQQHVVWQHTHASWSENTWPGITGFQPIGTLGVFKQRGFKAMFWTHWEPKSRYTWVFRETGCCLPSWRDEGLFQWLLCIYLRIRCLFLRKFTLLILLIKRPVHGENCVHMCI
jgi:hypothetical protein